MSKAPAHYSIRGLVIPVFLPSLLFSIGENSLIPLIPANAQKMGAGLGLAGLIAGLIMVGTLVADLPAGRLVDIIGERRAMIYAAITAAAGILLSAFAVNLWMLAAGILTMGAASAVFALARHAFMAEHIPLSHRARALSILGGMFRGGAFFGPMLGSMAVWLGGITAVYWVAVITCSVAAVVLLTTSQDSILATPPSVPGKTLAIAKREWRKLATVGVGVSMIGVLRTTRQIGLPLWAITIGLKPELAALYIGLANALELAFFYVSGAIMDRFGRRWAAVPTIVGLSISHLLVGLAFNSTTFFVIALVMALSNGVGSGIILVLGADLAPADGRNEFLASYRLITDAAVAGSPALLTGLAAVLSVSGAMAVIGVLGFGGAVLLWRYIPRYSPKPVRA